MFLNEKKTYLAKLPILQMKKLISKKMKWFNQMTQGQSQEFISYHLLWLSLILISSNSLFLGESHRSNSTCCPSHMPFPHQGSHSPRKCWGWCRTARRSGKASPSWNSGTPGYYERLTPFRAFHLPPHFPPTSWRLRFKETDLSFFLCIDHVPGVKTKQFPSSFPLALLFCGSIMQTSLALV